ncbi:MAG: DNA mismatch repair endonuclease MutL [Clostridia bacterium]|nr:DNA mismatch repair endonuclease MutL [Clostridia bacterium]
MSKINVLDSSVYNLIAAGEVVERPASVIKELVENSIDAKSTIVSIEIYGGGIKKMVVSDNGTGIEKDELKKAFLPHATSKISSKEDLNSIFTLGFRGEALASVCAVSHISIISKPSVQAEAYKITATAGQISEPEVASANNGTIVTVEDLFYNVPARAKFLKKEKSEEGEITSLVAKLILANPNVAFRYLSEGKLIYESSGHGEKDALFAIYGKTALNETLNVNYDKLVKIHGFLGKPSLNKPNRTYQTIIINGRFINSFQISSAVANALDGFLMKRQYPFFVYYIDIPTDLVDVNVHPNKLEVRFSNGEMVYGAVYNATLDAINTLDSIASVTPFKENVAPANLITEEKASEISSMSFGFGNTDDIVEEEQLSNVDEIQKARESYLESVFYMNENSQRGVADGFGLGSNLLEKLANAEKEEKFNKVSSEQTSIEVPKTIINVGKVFKTYLILEDNNNMFLIDQHAAHERLLYEKFKAQAENDELVIQPLLAPYIVTVNSQEKPLIESQLDKLNSIGFNISEFGDNTYKIDEVPAIVSGIDFNEFFGKFLEETRINPSFKNSDLVKDELMQLACKSAIKGGYDLSESEIEKLYSMLGKEKVALFCPHGRPIVVRISKNEMDKWFKRIV